MPVPNPHKVGLQEMYSYLYNIQIHESFSIQAAKSAGEDPAKYQRNLNICKALLRIVHEAGASQTSLQQLLINYPA